MYDTFLREKFKLPVYSVDTKRGHFYLFCLCLVKVFYHYNSIAQSLLQLLQRPRPYLKEINNTYIINIF